MNESEKPHALEYAKHQPDHILTDGLFTTRWKIKKPDEDDLAAGLFRTLRKGDREREKLDITRESPDGTRIRFIGFEPLDTWDQRLLTGLIAMAGACGKPLDTVQAMELNPLACSDDAKGWAAITAACPLSALLRGIGLEPTGNAYTRAKESLTRLENVGVIISYPPEPGQTERRRSSFNLLKYDYTPGARADSRFTLNPLLTRAIYAKKGGYLRLELSEMRAIKRDGALKLWHRLSGGIRAGKDGPFNIETLARYIYPEYDEAPDENRRKYRARTREALREITEATGWKAREYAAGKYLITRPPGKTGETPALALPPVALLPAPALPAVAA